MRRRERRALRTLRQLLGENAELRIDSSNSASWAVGVLVGDRCHWLGAGFYLDTALDQAVQAARRLALAREATS